MSHLTLCQIISVLLYNLDDIRYNITIVIHLIVLLDLKRCEIIALNY